MHCTVKITEDMHWVGDNDRRIELFENVYPVPNGVSYNAYVVLDEKTVLLDTADKAVYGQFMENVAYVLGDRKLDYVIVNHMEPDHCASLGGILQSYPEAQVVCTAKAEKMVNQFFGVDISDRVTIVKEGDSLETGRHKFVFTMMPMVHWPEAMATYDATDKILYSADAFGSFGAIDGNIFDDEVELTDSRIAEMRRYFTNIVGKYGAQVQAVLKKAAGLEIKMLCPLHGLIWRKELGLILEKYQKWSSYEAEDKAVMIAYGSIHGNTENAANILAFKLAELGVKNISVYDVSKTHYSVIIAESFRCSHLVFASATYNNEIFTPVANILTSLKEHNQQNRKVSLIQNGSWAPNSGKLMQAAFEGMKNMELVGDMVTINSSVSAEQERQLGELAKAIAESLKS